MVSQHFLSLAFLIIAVLAEIMWYLPLLLIFTSLVSDVHFFMYLNIFVSCFKKWLVRSINCTITIHVVLLLFFFFCLLVCLFDTEDRRHDLALARQEYYVTELNHWSFFCYFVSSLIILHINYLWDTYLQLLHLMLWVISSLW